MNWFFYWEIFCYILINIVTYSNSLAFGTLVLCLLNVRLIFSARSLLSGKSIRIRCSNRLKMSSSRLCGRFVAANTRMRSFGLSDAEEHRSIWTRSSLNTLLAAPFLRAERSQNNKELSSSELFFVSNIKSPRRIKRFLRVWNGQTAWKKGFPLCLYISCVLVTYYFLHSYDF